MNNIKYLILLLLFVGLSVSFYFVLSKMKKQDKDNKQIPRFSTLQASLIGIGVSFLVCSILFLIANKLEKNNMRSQFDNEDMPPRHHPLLQRNNAMRGSYSDEPDEELEPEYYDEDTSEYEDF